MLTQTEAEDKAEIAPGTVQGIDCAWLSINEDGNPNSESDVIYAALIQNSSYFPSNTVKLQVFPTESTFIKGSNIYGAAVHFVDDHGNAVIFGFSDSTDHEMIYQYNNGSRLLVILPSAYNQWNDYELELGSWWETSGWDTPGNIDIYVTLLNDYLQPGEHTFGISGITEN